MKEWGIHIGSPAQGLCAAAVVGHIKRWRIPVGQLGAGEIRRDDPLANSCLAIGTLSESSCRGERSRRGCVKEVSEMVLELRVHGIGCPPLVKIVKPGLSGVLL